MNIPAADFHTHTKYCDGHSAPRSVVNAALARGFCALGFSGHMDTDIHMDMDAYVREIRSLQKEYAGRLEILCGVELDNLYDPACAGGLDYVIGSTHFIDVPYERALSVDACPGDMELMCREFFGGDYYRLCRAYFETEAKVYDRLHCDFVGHFDLVTKFSGFGLPVFVDEEDPRYLGPAFEAMEYLAGQGVPFEINTRQAKRGRIYPGKALLKRLHELGGEIILSSDAHRAGELGGGFEQAAAAAAECGFDHCNLLRLREGGGTELVPFAF